jgi:hypothetical protein
MGELGSIMGAFKGPEDPGIQAAVSGGGAGFTPTSHAGEIEAGGFGGSAPPAKITPGVGTASSSDDDLKRLSAQLNFANSVAGMGRGLYSDLSRGGPGGSPLAARPAGVAGPYQPTARGGMRLSDILGRR